MEFLRFLAGTKWIYVGNDDRVEVKGIGTCKLHLRGGRTILLHDVLFAPGIRRNLISVVVLLKLGFSLNFCGNSVRINNGNICYGFGHVEGGFVVLEPNTYNYYVDRCFSMNVSSSSKELNVDTSYSMLD